jgi:hypothetical protein
MSTNVSEVIKAQQVTDFSLTKQNIQAVQTLREAQSGIKQEENAQKPEVNSWVSRAAQQEQKASGIGR